MRWVTQLKRRGLKVRVDVVASSIHQALSAGLSSAPPGGKGPKSAGGSWADNLASFRSDTAAREKALNQARRELMAEEREETYFEFGDDANFVQYGKGQVGLVTHSPPRHPRQTLVS